MQGDGCCNETFTLKSFMESEGITHGQCLIVIRIYIGNICKYFWKLPFQFKE